MNILITGGASGLGEAITRRLASDPSNKVYFSFFSSVENAKAIETEYSNAEGIKCDFTSTEDLNAFLLKIQSREIQVLINNAMTGFEENYFHKLSADYFIDSFKKNIIPVVQITQALLVKFRKKKFGKIITILSAAIINKPPIGWSEYVASKSYLLSLSKSWAAENASFNITANCISPSLMQTKLTSNIDVRLIEELIDKHNLKALLTTDEVADVVKFYVDASQQINGTHFLINSGQNVI